MDDMVIIRTSDEPPVELKASRPVLIAGSKVFSDMLSIPQGIAADSGTASFDVAETENQFKPFLRLLNIAQDEGDPLEELDRLEGWPNVARLADKYDGAWVKGLAIGKYWYLMKHSEAPETAFQIAVTLNLQALVKEPLFNLMGDGYSCADLAMLVKDRQLQFNEWMQKLKAHALDRALRPTAAPWLHCNGHSCATCDEYVNKYAWLEGMRVSLQTWSDDKAYSPFKGSCMTTFCSSGLCSTHSLQLLQEVDHFEQEYRDTAPDFPL